jgi:cadherin EGF LAG seven-pass G-type receptor 1
MCLHYFSVAMFTWIMIDSVHIYRMLSELRDINHGRMTFYAGAGFGIPALVVGLTVGVSGNNYAAPSFCWLSYYHTSVWGMLGPEIGCALIHTITMLFNLKIVFRVKTAADIEDDFKILRRVFFVNLGLLPLAAGFHAAALIMINERAPMSIYIFVALALVFSFYLLCGFMLGDKSILRALAACTSRKGKGAKHRGGPPLASQRGISRSSLTYRQSTSASFKHKPPPNNLDVAEVSVASTTSQSTYQTSSKIKASHFDDLDVTRSYNLQHSQNSESDSDMDRRSLDLASSHTSDDEYDTNNMYEPSDLKALSVNDYPQY